ncbi:hypothetical protein [Hyphomicrobium sp. 99]|uniref:hypothetical protein n=1 Tax=Hyphomicrobium sp. 99 TaxID=1163419 RepID=UPI0012E0895B|nr:hypothetical protein [Hyphomicrobium sp. 99]
MTTFIVRTVQDLEHLQALWIAGENPYVRYERVRFEQIVPLGIDTLTRANAVKAVSSFLHRTYALIRYGRPNARYLTKRERSEVKVDFVEDGDKTRFAYDASRALNKMQEAGERQGKDFKDRSSLFERLTDVALRLTGKEENGGWVKHIKDGFVEAFAMVPEKDRGSTLSRCVAAVALCIMGWQVIPHFATQHQVAVSDPRQAVIGDLEQTTIYKTTHGAPVEQAAQIVLAKATAEDTERYRKILVTKGPTGFAVRYVIDEYRAVVPAMLDMAADSATVMNGAAFEARVVKQLRAKARGWKTTVTVS